MNRSVLLASWAMLTFFPCESGADDARPLDGRPRSARSDTDSIRGVRIPVHFEFNRGQAGSGVDFVARGASLTAHLSSEGAALLVGGFPAGSSTRDPQGCEERSAPEFLTLPIRWEGADPAARLRAERSLPGKSNYLLGNDPAQWIRGVPHAAAVVQRGAWPGVDIRWEGHASGGLGFRFVIEPGADPGLVRIRFPREVVPRLDGSGNLVLATTLGPVVLRAPTAFQRIAGRRVAVQSAFSVAADGLVALSVSSWSSAHVLDVGPDIDYSSYCYAEMKDLAVDADGSLHACGAVSTSNLFPSTNAYQPAYAGDGDGFVLKLDPTGTSVEYATYLGGKYTDTVQTFGFDRLNGIEIDLQGRAMVGGYSVADNYPTTTGAFQKNRAGAGSGGGADGVLTVLDESGSALVWSSYLGGTSTDEVRDLLCNSAGEVVAYGEAGSGNFPVKDAAQGTHGGDSDVFVTVISATGTTILRSSFLGGSSSDRATRVRVDGAGRVCVVGYTSSSNLPVKNAYQSTLSGESDCFLARMAADGKSFDFVTYFGTASTDFGRDMALDPQGRWFLVGETYSTSFPLSAPVQAAHGGGLTEGFVSVFDADVTNLEFSTYLGGSGADSAIGIQLDAAGAPLVVGYTSSSDFPLISPVDSVLDGVGADAFITQYATDLSEISWSTYYGGAGSDLAQRVAPGIDDDLWVHVECLGGTFPVEGGFKSSGDSSAFFRVNMPAIFTNAPSNLLAQFLGLTSVRVQWRDPGSLETGFRLQWRTGEGEWEDLAILDANVTFYDVSGLAPETTYGFRVSAFNDLAETGFVGPVTITMPPTPLLPPIAPSGLTATVLGSAGIELSWQDNGSDEVFFQLVRATVDGGPFTTIATPSLNTTFRIDQDVRPDREYWYMVKAVNQIGSSTWSNVVSAETPATLAPALVTGRISDSLTISRDTISLTLQLPAGASSEAAPDPREHELILRLGDGLGPTFVSVPAGDIGWRTNKRGRATWKSPRESLSKVRVRYDTVTGTMRVRATRLNFPQTVSLPIRVTLEIGDEGGHVDAEWLAGRRPGQFKFP